MLVSDKNKIDYVRNVYKNSVVISAQRGINISALTKKILDLIELTFVEGKIDLEISDSRSAARVHSLAEVLSKRYKKNKVEITYRAKKENSDKIKKIVNGT